MLHFWPLDIPQSGIGRFNYFLVDTKDQFPGFPAHAAGIDNAASQNLTSNRLEQCFKKIRFLQPLLQTTIQVRGEIRSPDVTFIRPTNLLPFDIIQAFVTSGKKVIILTCWFVQEDFILGNQSPAWNKIIYKIYYPRWTFRSFNG